MIPHFENECPSCKMGLPIEKMTSVMILDKSDGKIKTMVFNERLLKQLMAQTPEPVQKIEPKKPKEYASFDEYAKDHGFVNATEFHKLNSSLDLTTFGARAAYNRWKDENGTKADLEKLIARYGVKPSFKAD